MIVRISFRCQGYLPETFAFGLDFHKFVDSVRPLVKQLIVPSECALSHHWVIESPDDGRSKSLDDKTSESGRMQN